MSLLQVNGSMMPGYILNEMLGTNEYKDYELFLVFYSGAHLLIKEVN